MLEESLQYQEEVTDTLGEQVKRAVEVLVQCLDKADEDRNRELLQGVTPAELYEAGLTIMMRLVFILCAEERGLLLCGDPLYDNNYAISTLRGQLADEADQHGAEVLERRHDAWERLLALFRAVYGGIAHESLRMPALGGSLFDPDRFPFLEGRAKDTLWQETHATPLPIDNRTVLLLLNALQLLEQPGGALLLSYRALDVEQIGHVYEGLLEHTVTRAREITLGLQGTKKSKNPNLSLRELETAHAAGEAAVVKLLVAATERSTSAIRRALNQPPAENLLSQVIGLCGGNTTLVECLSPYVNLLRTDAWGSPIIYHANAFMVTLGADRRETGTHYTPKSLTEKIVAITLEPIVYSGPATGLSRKKWQLRSPAELLELKVCDPAMGSGAFLVQCCRYLAERLVEAWLLSEEAGKQITIDGSVVDRLDGAEPMPVPLDDRLTLARRLISERCLYGVDINPLAVELAKLSIWLITLAKDRPFGFLDHNLRSGDSLLGIHQLQQLTQLTIEIKPDEHQPQHLFGQNIEAAVNQAIEKRNEIRQIEIRDIRDIQAKAAIEAESQSILITVKVIANSLIGEVLAADGNQKRLEGALAHLSAQAEAAIIADQDALDALQQSAIVNLSLDQNSGKPARRPFHWPLEFPEVFQAANPGFDAMVGNPPFVAGQRITGILGTIFRNWLVEYVADGRRGSADLVAYFFLRAWHLIRSDGNFGFLAVNTIAEGDTRQVGLEAMLNNGATIYAAWPNEPWPGKAAMVTSRIHIHKGQWQGVCTLLDKPAPFISAFLSDREEWSPKQLKANANIAFIGSYVLGMGYTLTEEEAQEMLAADPKNSEVIFPYLNGRDLNSHPEQKPSRWVINFWDWSEERAQEYTLPWQWVEENVKPDRHRKNSNGKYVCSEALRCEWWLFEGRRIGLFHSVGKRDCFEKNMLDILRKTIKFVVPYLYHALPNT